MHDQHHPSASVSLALLCAPWLEWHEGACRLAHKRLSAAQTADQLHGQVPYAIGHLAIQPSVYSGQLMKLLCQGRCMRMFEPTLTNQLQCSK